MSNPMFPVRNRDLSQLSTPRAAMALAQANAATRIEFGTDVSFGDLCQMIWRAKLKGTVPVGLAWGNVNIWELFPSPDCSMPWDPLKAALMNISPSNQHLFQKATESSGSATALVSGAAGTYCEISTWKIELDTDPDQQGTRESKVTLTFSPYDTNADLIIVQEDATSGVSTYTAQEETNSFLFSLPNGGNGGVYWHLARKPSTRPNVTWTRAIVATPVASGEHPTYDFETAVTALVSGSLVSVATTAITADAAEFPSYARYLLEKCYTEY